MVRKLKNFVWSILNLLEIGGPIELRKEGGLLADGWYKSFTTKDSVDKNGNPIPWFTYSFMKYFEPKINDSWNVFEYGAGSSTVWFSKKVTSITSVEHHKGWFESIQKYNKSNIQIILVENIENGDYAKFIKTIDKKYDLIIVDGMDRVNCLKNSYESLTEDGVILLDNSDRVEYQEGIKFLKDKGFKELNWVGNAPVVSIYSSTSILYRENNCLNI